MHDLAPVVLVKNEETWIARVLRPLVAQFGLAIVGDTGSTDRTRDEAGSVPGVELLELGPMSAPELGQARRTLGRRALELGRQWIMQVDGDELYHPAALAWIAERPMPAGKRLGYTAMLTIDLDEETGEYWELDDLFSRAAVMEAGVAWAGDYPFEAPVSFGDPAGFFYWDTPAGLRYHALHLHRLQRSPHDDAVLLRQQKQHQFSMIDRQVPRTRPLDAAGWW
jgi:glycosyltransferase involved in cell wall biosynthesis